MTDFVVLAEKIKARTVENESGCWVYPTNNSDGYARVTIPSSTTKSGYTTVRPSRVMYEVYVGPIPVGMELDHVKARGCTSNACCFPGHLEPVTGRENKLRGDTVLARNVAKTHCPAGHEYDEINTYITPRGARLCRVCHKIKKAERRRAAGAGIPNGAKTHCPQGHLYDEVNTIITPGGQRKCLTCRRERDRLRAQVRRVKAM